MEIKKEDLVMLRTFEDKFYVAFKPSILDELDIPEKVIELIKEEVEEAVPTEEELAEIAKAKEIETLKAKLKDLEE